ncbi:MAG TPA: hypothetical protein VMG98_15545 [Verrucomicrobiae bacterium]|nr:hypothetical protein [Verrucomicrobiae bacterium]
MRVRSGSLFGQAIIAGIIGGIVVDAFLSISHHISPIELWTGMAAAAAGPGSPWWIGLSVHVVVSLVWAVLYAYLANAIGQLGNWIIGGIVWGAIVTAVMALIVSLKTGSPWAVQFAQDFLGTDVFYALPMAFYLSRAAR